MGNTVLGQLVGAAVVASVLAASAASADVFNMPGGEKSLELLPVGDAGNLADARQGHYGAVPYAYAIGKWEVTNGQYRAFLNAVARTDTHGLYCATGYFGDGGMGGPYGGISRNGASGDYAYTPKDGDAAWDSKPVNFVSWFNCLRFVNWLHNGQPSAPQGPSTTEDGAYDLSLGLSAARKPGARFALPNADEWYKSAYYKGDSPDAGYWEYATRHDEVPNNHSPASDTGNSANYYDQGHAVGGPYYTSDVGAYARSLGPYGTLDQNGNIMEWTETASSASSGQYWAFGGAWLFGANYLGATDPAGDADPTVEVNYLGFRVVQVPEPATAAVLGLVAAALIARRPGRK
jgi:formylglycine-generating enzyme required for sulfatase activity